MEYILFGEFINLPSTIDDCDRVQICVALDYFGVTTPPPEMKCKSFVIEGITEYLGTYVNGIYYCTAELHDCMPIYRQQSSCTALNYSMIYIKEASRWCIFDNGYEMKNFREGLLTDQDYNWCFFPMDPSESPLLPQDITSQIHIGTLNLRNLNIRIKTSDCSIRPVGDPSNLKLLALLAALSSGAN